MRTSRLSLVGTVILVLLGMLAVAVVAQSETEAPAGEESAIESPAASADPAASPLAAGEARVIEIEAGVLRFEQEGEQIQHIEVTPGETVRFRIDNTTIFTHNFYIGADEDLRVARITDIGIADFETGVQELEWVVPEDIADLRFACTVPGHYLWMQGDFVIAP